MGAGAAAGSLLPALKRAGWPVSGLAARTAEAARSAAGRLGVAALGSPESPEPGLRSAAVVVIAVSDGAITDVARLLAGSSGPWTGRVALHVSGALASDALAPLAAAGAGTASWHPLATLPPGGGPAPAGIPYFGEGTDAGVEMARLLSEALGGSFSRLAAEAKPAYHAAATIAGNLVTVLHAAAAEVLREQGVAEPERALAVLARASLESAIERPGLAGLTGPVARADAGTLERNVAALAGAPAALRAAHAALSLLAADAMAAGKPPDPARDRCVAILVRELMEATLEVGRRRPPEPGEPPARVN